jgi:aspartate/methionine/tyrosine aminotransferase
MLSISDINPKLLSTQYAVRGAIVQRAQELEAQGREIVYCNIGNPQALGQLPLSYIRQTLALLEYPELLQKEEIVKYFPQDVVEKAKFILNSHPFGTGAYTHSTGITFVREAIAEFIQNRDGVSIKADHIFLTDGASKGVQSVIFSLIKNEQDGLMIPIPQYPLYSASLQMYGGRQVGYFLDEEKGWSLNEEVLESAYEEAKKSGINPVGIVVINPGNPTGAVLLYETIQMVVRFAKKHNLAILADEVYQENIYEEGLSFTSFAKVMHEMNEQDVTLFSFHSVSKGYLGECGHRGGYIEFRNIPSDVLAAFEKLQSVSLCANVIGQLVTYLMISPPQEGDASYAAYILEKDGILRSLHERAKILAEGLNAIDGVHVEIPQGAMYAFVRVELPEGKTDSEYCLSLLEETGICVVPGSGFGQLAGTSHFRTTFLPPKEQIKKFVEKFAEFHKRFIK